MTIRIKIPSGIEYKHYTLGKLTDNSFEIFVSHYHSIGNYSKYLSELNAEDTIEFIGGNIYKEDCMTINNNHLLLLTGTAVGISLNLINFLAEHTIFYWE